MREELELNRRHWDEATQIHTRGNVYGIDEFKAGLCRLHPIEVREVGDVRGKTLLHLQCHFGLDTLSWARRGADVTGVDFSPEGIAFARALSQETGVPGRFVESDLYELTRALDAPRAFDIVYTSYGAINWLPDLGPWGRVIAHYLKPGGCFHIVEAHPTARIFPMDDDLKASPDARAARTLPAWFSYFHDPAGLRWAPAADYADPNATTPTGTHEWQHSMSDILNALIQAGLAIEWLHEFPVCAWQIVAGSELVERFSSSHGYYGLPAAHPKLPLMFSVRARKPHA
jgi:SAM-dependent methyltransferase